MISSTTKSMQMLYSCKWNLPQAASYCGLSWDKTKNLFKDYLIMDKIDTQAMSYGTGKGDGTSIEEQRDAIPPATVREVNILTDELKKELKQLINEVLDERLKHK